eukprot:TRINITY_DN40214_c0_g1_i1.p1 TRINITY_DN40214_c0_g1~~TRINITY_DN40214_c0_g1_i1.p1  ORF type:complete len:557 (-),score=81.96 TRINITY_DN40214_c0_g1_i1:108-1778(-)
MTRTPRLCILPAGTCVLPGARAPFHEAARTASNSAWVADAAMLHSPYATPRPPPKGVLGGGGTSGGPCAAQQARAYVHDWSQEGVENNVSYASQTMQAGHGVGLTTQRGHRAFGQGFQSAGALDEFDEHDNAKLPVGNLYGNKHDIMPWMRAEIERVKKLKEEYLDYGNSLVDRLASRRRGAIFVPHHIRKSANESVIKRKTFRKKAHENIDVQKSKDKRTREDADRQPQLDGFIGRTDIRFLNASSSRPKVARKPESSPFEQYKAKKQQQVQTRNNAVKQDKHVIQAYMNSAKTNEEKQPDFLDDWERGDPVLPSHPVDVRTASALTSLHQWINSNNGAAAQLGPVRIQVESEGRREAEKDANRMSISFAKKFGCQVSYVRDNLRMFNEYDRHGDGEISWADFLDSVRKRANLPRDVEIPTKLMGSLMYHPTPSVTFEQYVQWAISVTWTEEMQVESLVERELRGFAREHNMAVLDVERIRKVFDKFDLDGSGEIEELEFRNIICTLWNVRDPTEIPTKRLARFWRDVDADGCGSINFEEFLIWYHKQLESDAYE